MLLSPPADAHDLDDPPAEYLLDMPSGDFVRTAIRQAEPFHDEDVAILASHSAALVDRNHSLTLMHREQRHIASAAAADAVSAEARTKAVTAQRDSLRKQIELHAARVDELERANVQEQRARAAAERARDDQRIALAPALESLEDLKQEVASQRAAAAAISSALHDERIARRRAEAAAATHEEQMATLAQRNEALVERVKDLEEAAAGVATAAATSAERRRRQTLVLSARVAELEAALRDAQAKLHAHRSGAVVGGGGAAMTAEEVEAAAAAEGLRLARVGLSENPTGYDGVYEACTPGPPYEAKMKKGDGRYDHLGRFESADEAALAVARYLADGTMPPAAPTAAAASAERVVAEEAVAVAEVRAETRVAARLQRQWEAKALQLQAEFEEMLGRVHAREKTLKEKVAAQDREIELLKKGLRSEHIATVDARKEAKEAREAEAAAAASAAAAAFAPPPPPVPAAAAAEELARSIHALPPSVSAPAPQQYPGVGEYPPAVPLMLWQPVAMSAPWVQ